MKTLIKKSNSNGRSKKIECFSVQCKRLKKKLVWSLAGIADQAS